MSKLLNFLSSTLIKVHISVYLSKQRFRAGLGFLCKKLFCQITQLLQTLPACESGTAASVTIWRKID